MSNNTRKPADLTFEEFTEMLAGAFTPGYDDTFTAGSYKQLYDAASSPKSSTTRSCNCGAELTYGLAQVLQQPFLHSDWCPCYRDTRQQETKADGDVNIYGDRYDPWNT